jgi:hypothetical protein
LRCLTSNPSVQQQAYYGTGEMRGHEMHFWTSRNAMKLDAKHLKFIIAAEKY